MVFAHHRSIFLEKDIDLQFHQEYVRDEISPNHQLPEHEGDE